MCKASPNGCRATLPPCGYSTTLQLLTFGSIHLNIKNLFFFKSPGFFSIVIDIIVELQSVQI